MGVGGQSINCTNLFSLLRMQAAHTRHLHNIRKQAWVGESVLQNTIAKQNATEAERKARYRSLAWFSRRFSAVEAALFDGGGPDSGPATSGPCPPPSAASPAGQCGAGTTARSLPSAPPRAASRLFTFKITFPWRPRRKQTCGSPLRAMGYVCLSGSRDIAAYLSEGSLGRVQSSEGP